MNPGVEVRVNGQPLEAENLHEVRVEQSLMLPDAFFVEATPDWRKLHEGADDLLGAEVEILFAATDPAKTLTSVLQGQVLEHSQEMYGYMAVYLRLKGIVPPSSEQNER